MENVELGTKLILRPEKRMKFDPKFELVSCLEAITDDGFIVIQTPLYSGALYHLSVGDILLVNYVVVKEGCREFRCTVAGRFKEGLLDYTKAKIISDIEHIQRRDYFRVETSLTGMIYAETEKDGKTQQLELNCLCVDISEFGAALLLNHEDFSVGDNITVSLPVKSETQSEKISAEIRWIRQLPMDHARRYKIRIGVKFDFAEKNTQKDTVMKYVIHRQQEILKSRRLR